MLEITRGIVPHAEKVVIYGPEGIGKTTFAAQFPDPLFIDTEAGSLHLDVKRLPRPTSWTMLLEDVKEVARTKGCCETLVLDTADWAETLCIQHVIAKEANAKITGIEDFGYGKGYTYVAEEFGKLLNALSEVTDAGIGVVVTAHAVMRKFEQPDEIGAYDRWELKLSRKVAPMVKEWADMVLFANYETNVMTDGNGHAKASGGKRVLYTSHHACWDAKNRWDLPEKLAFDYSSISQHTVSISTTDAPHVQEPVIATETVASSSHTESSDPMVAAMAKALEPKPHVNLKDVAFEEVLPEHVSQLRDLMKRDGITERQLQSAVASQGYRTENTPITKYDAALCAQLMGAWDAVKQVIREQEDATKDIPFR